MSAGKSYNFSCISSTTHSKVVLVIDKETLQPVRTQKTKDESISIFNKEMKAADNGRDVACKFEDDFDKPAYEELKLDVECESHKIISPPMVSLKYEFLDRGLSMDLKRNYTRSRGPELHCRVIGNSNPAYTFKWFVGDREINDSGVKTKIESQPKGFLSSSSLRIKRKFIKDQNVSCAAYFKDSLGFFKSVFINNTSTPKITMVAPSHAETMILQSATAHPTDEYLKTTVTSSYAESPETTTLEHASKHGSNQSDEIFKDNVAGASNRKWMAIIIIISICLTFAIVGIVHLTINMRNKPRGSQF